MPKGFIFDPSRCMGCKGCEMACKVRYELPAGDRRRRVYTKELGTFPATSVVCISMACNHCADPACLKACPKGAITKDAVTGVVMHDKAKCVGCRRCEWACPYGAIAFNSVTKKVDKCEACYNQPDGPACALICPAKALTWGEIAAPDAEYPGVELPSPGLTNPNFKFVK